MEIQKNAAEANKEKNKVMEGLNLEKCLAFGVTCQLTLFFVRWKGLGLDQSMVNAILSFSRLTTSLWREMMMYVVLCCSALFSFINYNESSHL